MNSYKEKAFKDTYITGATVVDHETFMFVAQGDENLVDKDRNSIWGELAPPARIIAYNTSRDSWSWLEYKDSIFSGGLGTLAGGYICAHKRAIAVNHLDVVAYFEFSEGVNSSEKTIPTNIIMGSRNPRLIGDHFYVAGAVRRIARRLAVKVNIFNTGIKVNQCHLIGTRLFNHILQNGGTQFLSAVSLTGQHL